MPQEDNLDLELTVRENLYVYGRYFDLPRRELRARIEQLLDFAQLTERADDRVDPLSGGMKRRLTIARSLVNEPELLLLDEPTTGLDPQARHALWDRLYRLKAEGVTLVLTTHYMDEAEQLCDRLVVMDGGRIAAEGSPRRSDRPLLAPGRWSSCGSARARASAWPARWPTSPSGSRSCPTGCCSTPTRATRRSTAVDGPRPGAGRASWSAARTLEDVFLRLTGRHLVD